MNRRLYVYCLLFMIPLLIFFGCKGEEQTKSKEESGKQPQSLTEVQSLSDEIVKSTMKKDWPDSLSKSKELQSKWNELYSEIQKKGITEGSVDSFVADINKLSDALIAKTMTMPKTEVKKSEEEQQSQNQGGQQSGQQGQSSGQQQEGQQQGQQNTQQDGQQQQETEMKEQPTESKKALDEVDPTLTANKEELAIIRDAIEVMKSIPVFMGVYGGKVPPDLYKLKYLVYNVNITSKLDNWEQANKTSKEIEEIWDKLELKMIKVDEELAIQIKQSLKELQNVVSEKNIKLIGLKSNNVIEYLEKSVKTFEEKEQEKSEE